MEAIFFFQGAGRHAAAGGPAAAVHDGPGRTALRKALLAQADAAFLENVTPPSLPPALLLLSS